MATLTEVSVVVAVRATTDDGTPRVSAQAKSLAADGTVIRTMNRDITDLLSPARLQGVADLLADVEARAKTLWEIP